MALFALKNHDDSNTYGNIERFDFTSFLFGDGIFWVVKKDRREDLSNMPNVIANEV